MTEHKRGTLPTKGQALQNYRDKEAYLQYEVSINKKINYFNRKCKNHIILFIPSSKDIKLMYIY